MVLRNERGLAIIWIAVSLVLILGMAALAIDLSFLYTDKNYLHVAADGSSLAGASQLVSATDCLTSSGSENDLARTTAREYAAFHSGGSGADGAVDLDINSATNDPNGDIVLGNYTHDTGFTACDGLGAGTPINAVRVNANRDDAPSFFGGIFGTPISNVGTYATASAGVRATIPICVPDCVATNDACEDITMQPEGSENAAWTGFFGSKDTQTLVNLVNNPESIPCASIAGSEPINLDNGEKTPVFNAILDAYNTYKDADGKWCVTLPTCASSCNPPPNECSTAGTFGSGDGAHLPVSGLTSFCITSVIPTGVNKGIYGEFEAAAPGAPAGNCSLLVE